MDNRCIGITEFRYLKSLCDKMRIINPITNEVKEISNNNNIRLKDSCCYEFWKRNEKCENCIAIRALKENRTLIKIDFKDDRIYSITATPVEENDGKYVIEYIKDITDSMLVYDVSGKDIANISEEITKLNKLVITDELTNCYNRRYINERLPIEINNSKKDGLDLSIAMIDIDYFKEVNDKFNHVVGDFVLKEVAQIINMNIRSNYDWIGRYGGEEFILVFKNSNKEKAIKLAERIRTIIEEYKFRYKDKELNITVSFGIAELTEDIETMDKIIEKADENLYKAKKMGRNLVIG